MKTAVSKFLIAPFLGAIFILNACGQSGGHGALRQGNFIPDGEMRIIEAPDGSLRIPMVITGFAYKQTQEPRLQPAVDDWRSTKVWQENDPACVPLPWQSEERAGPYESYIDASQIEGTVLYVSVKRYAEGGAVVPVSDWGIGTRDRPFRRLQDALDLAATYKHSVAVVVTDDLYEEDLRVPPGVFLLGSFSAFDWVRHSVAYTTGIANQNDAMIFEAATEQKPLTFVNGFGIKGMVSNGPSKGTVNLLPGAQVVLSHNKLISSHGVSSGKATGGILGAEDAGLQFYHNILIKEPFLVKATSGVFVKRSCTTLVKNHFIGFLNATYSERTTGEYLGNVIEGGWNGLRSRGENLYLEGNTIGLKKLEPFAGFLFAIYMETLETNVEFPAADNHPVILDNYFLLEGYGSHGINEGYDNSDPQILSGNHFVLFNADSPDFYYWKFILYFDKDSPHPPELNSKRIYDIDEVNAMADIPENGDNTLEIVDYDDYY